MEREGIESLPLYPEGRACRRPTARKVIDLFEDVQRHELSAGRRPAVVFTTKLSVGNGQRGYHFFGQAGTMPKSVRFGEVVPVRVGNGIFS